MKTIALESVDFFQKEWNCLEKHEGSDSMSRVVITLIHMKYLDHIMDEILEKHKTNPEFYAHPDDYKITGRN